MDKSTILGLLLGVGGVLGGALLEGTHVDSLINLPAFLIVVVGTIGASSLSFSLDHLLRLPKLLKLALFEQGHKGEEIVELFVHMATRARTEGVLSLEAEASQVSDPFLRKGLQLVVDGTDEEVIRQVMEADIAATAERHRSGYALFESMGGYAPTLGIMGAVLGLIHVLSQAEDPSKMAAGIAVAFVATLYGVGTANLIFLPLASKLRLRSEAEQHLRGLVLQGILAIQNGDNPRIVREKLEVFLAPKARSSATNAKDDAQGTAQRTVAREVA